jgi:hypothetical protein
VAAWTPFLQALLDWQPLCGQLLVEGEQGRWTFVLVSRVGRLRSLSAPALEALGCGASPLANLLAAQQQALEALPSWPFLTEGAARKAAERLAEASRETPDALLFHLEARLHLLLARADLGRADLAAYRRRLREVLRLCRRVGGSPSLAPRRALAYRTRLLAALADVGLLLTASPPAEGQIDRLRDNIHRLVVEGRSWPAARRRGLEALLELLMAAPEGKMGQEWRLDEKEGAVRFRARKEVLRDLGLQLLSGWQQDEPRAARPALLRGRLELWAENYHAALQAARTAAALAGDDKGALRQARELEGKSLAKLREQVQRLKGS